ncbi:MAG: molybdate ABC transporter substrate-binding protein [Firmicutes bacterium]|nr:molybdate ABC transporter substrate-binding protein [Bacillota bacterium]
MKTDRRHKGQRRFAILLTISMLILMITGCETESKADETELTVFAAASLTEALTELGDTYMSENENVKLTFNFDSSGTLQTQIEEGADCDIFISAGQAQMDALGDLVADSRFDILENKVVLAVPEGNPAEIQSYEDLRQRLETLETGDILLAMGNSDVPVGQYTQRILAYMNLDEEGLAKAGRITYGGNVKEVTIQIGEGAVDCGIIYATDASTAGLTAVDMASPEMCGQVIYPAATLSSSEKQEAAKAFLTWLKSEEGSKVFNHYGFTPLG